MKLKIGKIFLKFNPAIAVGRNAFLLLVKTNLFNLGSRIAELKKKPQGAAKIEKFWNKIGGNIKSLNKALASAAKKKAKKNSKHNFEEYCNFDALFFDESDYFDEDEDSDTFEPITIGAAAVAAAPIVAEMLKLLRENGVKTDDIEPQVKGVINKGAQDLINEHKEDMVGDTVHLNEVTVRPPNLEGKGSSMTTYMLVAAMVAVVLIVNSNK